MKDRSILVASPDERRRLEREREREHGLAQARALQVIARLAVDRETRRREAAYAGAELLAARLGRLTEPVKGGLLARLLGRAMPSDIVILGADELQATVKARREQLERYRVVEGPEAIRRADEVARLLVETLEEEGAVAPEPSLVSSTVAVRAPREHRVVDARAIAPDHPKPNGRASRSPYG